MGSYTNATLRKPARSANGLEHPLRPRICPVVVVDEAHRPAVHDGRDSCPAKASGLVFQMPHERSR